MATTRRIQTIADQVYSILRKNICEGQYPPGSWLQEVELCNQLGVSRSPVREALHRLVSDGLVVSVRGAQGGYRLARPETEITAGEILRAVEGELTAIPCLGANMDCPRRGQCQTLDFWCGLNDLINRYVDGVTLATLRTKNGTLAE